MKLEVLTIQGEKTGRKIDLPDAVFSTEPNDHAVYLAVKQYLANQRQGTHKSKERGEVAGSRRKIKRQKGTGGARFGDIKNPIFRGGGRVFGPKPRDYSLKLNKKLKRIARKSALSTKAANGQIIVVEDFSFDAPKTNVYFNILQSLSCENQKTVLVTADYEKDIYLSCRNLKKAKVTRVQDLNTYEVLDAQRLILSEGSIEKINEAFAN